MIVTTLTVCFLLSFLPLVIGTFSFRYSANIFSKSILTLSAISFLLGLAQFGLILGTSYRLFSPAHMKQAGTAIQYVSILGGTIMIIAGFFWVGYFRMLLKAKKDGSKSARPARQTPSPQPESVQVAPATPPAVAKTKKSPPRRRREVSAPERDWFTDELPVAPTYQLSAVVAPKKAVRIKKATRSTREE